MSLSTSSNLRSLYNYLFNNIDSFNYKIKKTLIDPSIPNTKIPKTSENLSLRNTYIQKNPQMLKKSSEIFSENFQKRIKKETQKNPKKDEIFFPKKSFYISSLANFSNLSSYLFLQKANYLTKRNISIEKKTTFKY